jgi:type VI secretion system secreted protein VgrG
MVTAIDLDLGDEQPASRRPGPSTPLSTRPGRPFVLEVPGYDGDLRVLAFRGRERVSRPFRFAIHVGVAPSHKRALEHALLGQPATLRIETARGPRSVCGIVAAVQARHPLPDGHAFLLTLVPRLWLLGRRKTSRIFQCKTVPQIVDAVLGEKVPHRSRLVGAYSERTYCVQYQETDLAFVQRILAEEGILYFFEHGTEETMVLGDARDAYRPIDGDGRLLYRPGFGGDGMNGSEPAVGGFSFQRRVRPGGVLTRDYDFRRPLLDLRAEATTSSVLPLESTDLRVYDHHGEDDRPDVDARTARVLWEQVRNDARLAVGTSADAHLVPGRSFELAEHDIDSLDGEYVVARVDHQGHAPHFGRQRRRAYSNRFQCAPADVVLRPRRPRHALQQVMETAQVVGPEGEEIHTDEYGRVKVQFPWDLDGKKNEHSSCWVRVAQAWAGSGWGAQFIPRVGMEVVVTFLGGDADRPLITGCVTNATNPPPFSLPKEKTRAGIRTRSTPGGNGANELSFEDQRGQEQIRIIAQKNLLEEVKHDRSAEIGHDDSLTVDGSSTIHVKGNQLVCVQGMLAEQVDGTKRTQLGTAYDTVLGNYDAFVGHNRDVMVKGSEKRTVLGDTVETFAGPHVVRAEIQHMLVVGSAVHEGQAAIQSTGGYTVNAEKHVRLVAGESLILACGDSTIELSPGGVTISAKVVQLKGNNVVCQGNGPALRLTDRAELLADAVKVYSKSGSLELDDKTTKIIGPLVQINPDLSKPSAKDGKDEKEMVPFSIRLTDEDFKPYANKKYELTVEELRLDGQTDGDGWVKHDVPKDARLASIDLWLDKYPTGAKRSYPIRLCDLAPATDVAGAQTRLKNLGYYEGAGGGTAIDSETATALRWFQRDHGLEETGKLDGKTVGKLAERFGH